jgi:hypothetical protein
MVFSIGRPGKPEKPGKNDGFQLLVHKIMVFTRFSWFPWSAKAQNHGFYLVFLVFMVF